MAELEEVHAFWSGRDIRVSRGPHAGKLGYCHGPCACYYYDVSLDDTGEIVGRCHIFSFELLAPSHRGGGARHNSKLKM